MASTDVPRGEQPGGARPGGPASANRSLPPQPKTLPVQADPPDDERSEIPGQPPRAEEVAALPTAITSGRSDNQPSEQRSDAVSGSSQERG